MMTFSSTGRGERQSQAHAKLSFPCACRGKGFLAALCLGGAAPAKSHNCLFLDRQGGKAIARARTALFIDRPGEKGFRQEPNNCLFLDRQGGKAIDECKNSSEKPLFQKGNFDIFGPKCRFALPVNEKGSINSMETARSRRETKGGDKCCAPL